MIPELGHFALILALLIVIAQMILPMWGSYSGRKPWMAVARPAAVGQFVFTSISLAALIYAFVVQDFSVAYVAQNSHSELPIYYRFSAVWGAHEGSLLLWVWIMSLWTVAVALFSRSLPEVFAARVLSVMGLISLGFMLFTLLTSNPFLRHVPALIEGADLNPLLQDFGLIIHPPMLYMGYVGFSVAFSFAIAALLGGQLDNSWSRWSRPWTNVAWSFLTLGIALGSWWAYYELGWGGWWFWDPVENASFMPWLVGTALIHSQAVTEKRGAFKSWTVLLAISAFSLSLLGAFLVRSGVLTSVHAFASDPARGLFILIFLGVVSGGALLLYALRAPRVASGGSLEPLSREGALMANNVLFTAAAVMVLIGTLWPLIADALNLGKMSVGAPYFGFMFVVLMLPVIVLMPFGPYLRWQSDSAARVFGWLKWVVVAAIGLTLVFWVLSGFDLPIFALFGLAGAFWVFFATLKYLRDRAAKSAGFSKLPRGVWGMATAHMGVGVFLIGVSMVENTVLMKDLRMVPGESHSMGAYRFEFKGIEPYVGPNFDSDRGTFLVYKNDEKIATLHPEKRAYRSQRDNVMTEAAIDRGVTRDVYIALGEPLDEAAKAWGVRLYIKPYVRWIWAGSLLMMLGGLIAATDRRYVLAVRRQAVADSLPEHLKVA